MRTMKSDAEELTRREQASFIDLVAEEAKLREKKEPQIRIRAPKKSRAKIIFAALAIIILAAGGAGMYVFLSKEKNIEQPLPDGGVDIPRPIINAQKMQSIKIPKDDRTGLLSEMASALSQSRGDKNFWYLPIVITDAGRDTYIATPREFFQTLRISVPSDDFWNGIGDVWNLYSYDEDFIFIFAVRDKPTLYGAMLSWERILPQQLATIIRRAKASPRTFSDKIIKNIDVRIANLAETDGHAVAWAIKGKDFLIIATSESAIRASIDRLVSE